MNVRKRTATVREHAPCSCKFMFIEAFLIDGLLGDYVAGSKQNLPKSLISIVSLLLSSTHAHVFTTLSNSNGRETRWALV